MVKKLALFSLVLLISCSSAINNSRLKQTDNTLLKDLELLSSDGFEGRKTGTKGAETARNYLITRMKAIGISPFSAHKNYEQLFEVNGRNNLVMTGKNLIGYIPGKTNNVIVLSAHYDHLGVVNNKVYNGADDNASGVAGLLYIAKHFIKTKPEHTLVFAFFDAEEMGLQGAKAFLKNPPVKLESVRLNINLDMISRSDKQELYVAGTFKYPELKPFLIHSNAQVKLLFGHDRPELGADDWTNQSDHGAFNARNIPFLYFGVEDHKDYHQESDEFKNIDKAFYINSVKTIKEVIINIDQQRDIQKIFRENLQMHKQ